MKIAIMSDSHDRWDLLDKAVESANQENAEVLLFAGDLIAPASGVKFLSGFTGDTHFIFGNNDGDKFKLTSFMLEKGITAHSPNFEGEFEGKKIFMDHYPRAAEIAAKSGEFDVCIYGHNHLYRLDKVGETILLNPGAILGDKEKSSFAFLDTDSMEVKRVILE